MYVLLYVLLLALLVGALVDIITSEQWRIRHLPKMLWIIIVILMPLIGSILWFAIGRNYARPVDRGSFGDPRRREGPASVPENYASRDTESELAALEREIAAYEKAERIRQLEAELRARRNQADGG